MADEVPTVKLYDGSTQIGSAGGYNVTNSGADSGTVFIQDLGISVTKDTSKTITVKGVLNTIGAGADSGSSVYVSVMAAGFRAACASARATSTPRSAASRGIGAWKRR